MPQPPNQCYKPTWEQLKECAIRLHTQNDLHLVENSRGTEAPPLLRAPPSSEENNSVRNPYKLQFSKVRR